MILFTVAGQSFLGCSGFVLLHPLLAFSFLWFRFALRLRPLLSSRRFFVVLLPLHVYFGILGFVATVHAAFARRVSLAFLLGLPLSCSTLCLSDSLRSLFCLRIFPFVLHMRRHVRCSVDVCLD